MHEDSINKRAEAKRSDLIRAKAFLDAPEYVALMTKNSPESLKLEPDGTITINTVEGAEIFNNARDALKLTPQEMTEYITNLVREIKIILSNK